MSASTPNTAPDPWPHVAAGVIRDACRRVLLSRRPQHVHQGGLWEFPGGKCEPGETARQALIRELAEELGIAVTAAEPLIQVRHRYPDRSVLLDVFEVTGFEGIPEGRENQPLAWVALEELDRHPLPAADRPIVTALRLPPRYPILEGGRTAARYQYWLEHLLATEHTLIYWRARDLDPEAYRKLLERFLPRVRQAGATLMLRADLEIPPAPGLGLGLHLDRTALARCRQRPAGWRWVAAACHTLAELQQAQSLGLDFAVLSPVLATPTHPDARPLGWDTAGDWLQQVNLPVYLLGGLKQRHLSRARRCGARGLAGIRAFLPEREFNYT
ncbi:8-oxo-dGTP diphosphatase [Methylomarinovum caldicuralii]|uniref:8-oxo-dGTP diphosphatase n=1 Tax=Methylomarinovum caldicuralii TaxID=438856 RepID=A0AAU9C0W6_9GAMM|nr:Nudix family hydrolase [Methylomarinovum caldicuralii]BCX80775.1 8-oxo-dGTP diphosphatase [Methylomarinovum caldicuralii]